MSIFKNFFLALTLCAALATPTETKPMLVVIAVGGLGLMVNGIYKLCTLYYSLPYSVRYKDKVSAYKLVIQNKKNKIILSEHILVSADPEKVIEEYMQLYETFKDCEELKLTIFPEITLIDNTMYQLSPIKIRHISKSNISHRPTFKKNISHERWVTTKNTLKEKLSQNKYTLKNRRRPQQFVNGVGQVLFGYGILSLLSPIVLILMFF